MGRHASDGPRRRRPAAWLVIAVVTIVLIAGLTVAYFLVLNRNKDTAAAACTGSTVLPVTVAPGSAIAITDAAAAFNATGPIARATCVSVSVTTMSGTSAATALAADWKGQRTPAPGLWVVDSASDVATLDAANSGMTAGHTNTALASSPVVLAMSKAPTESIGTWQSVAEGKTGVVMAIPDPMTNRASAYALESIVASVSPGIGGHAIDVAAVQSATPTLLSAARAVPTPPTTTAAALTELAAGSSSYAAVPVVESELAAFNSTSPTKLVAAYPSGPTAGDDMLAIPLTASWVSGAMSDAAAKFDAFLGDAKGLAVLAKDNLRTGGAPGPATAGVNLSTKVSGLPDTSAGVRDALYRAWSVARSAAPATPVSSAPPASSIASATAPPSVVAATTTPTTTVATAHSTAKSTAPSTTVVTSRPTPTTRTTPTAPPGPAVTLLLDTSGSMNTIQGSQQRIGWMQSALTADIGKSQTDLFGMWAFSTHEASSGYIERVPLGALTDQVNGGTRATALTAAINALTPGGDSWTYGAIAAAYAQAVTTAVPGRPNRLIVLTDGADTTPGMSRDALKTTLAGLAGQHPGVTLDIVGLSSDVNAQALTEVAATGGGTFTQVNDLANLQSTLLPLLSR